MIERLTILLAALVLVQADAARAVGQCAPFYDALDSAAGVAASGGSIVDSPTFSAGVNGNAAFLGGTATITFTDDAFAVSEGTVTFWVKPTSAGAQGGIFEIGTLGTPSSLGVFYINGSDLVCELRGANDAFNAVPAVGAFAQSKWTHVAAIWREGETGTGVWLYVDGLFVDYRHIIGAYNPSNALRLGATGYYGNGNVAIDELRFFDWRLHDSEVYAEYVTSSHRHAPQAPAKPTSTGPVRIVGRGLEVNGKPFKVHGAGYQPMPVGVESSGAALANIYTDPAILARDRALLVGLHANTIRTWGPPPDNTLLDVMYHGGVDPIYTLIGFWIPNEDVDYSDPLFIATYETRFRNLVRQFKDHPGVLGWGIGNEVNLNISGQAVTDFYALANRLAEVAYEEEGATYHPTVLVNGAMLYLGNTDVGSDDLSLNFVDAWGQNIYFGADAHCYFDYYDQLSAKPLIVTEYGIDAWDQVNGAEYPEVHAEYVVRQWRCIEQNSAGGTVFEFSDEWWKADDPSVHGLGGYGTDTHPDEFSNEEWYGLMSAADNGDQPDVLTPRLAYDRLALEYAHDPGDVDGDGDVDLRDFALVQTCLGAPAEGACGSALEFVIDGVITADDVRSFAQHLNGPND
ncbi:MAG: hypothetical protein H6817_07900 [Phycisphaerales bacterium]|nr:hypothetical protein [Phycisphaerales bacterium]